MLKTGSVVMFRQSDSSCNVLGVTYSLEAALPMICSAFVHALLQVKHNVGSTYKYSEIISPQDGAT